MQEKTEKPASLTPELRRRLILLGVKILGVILFIYILLFRIFGFVRIDTNAMSPSIAGGDLALIFHLNNGYAVGDVVNYRCGERTCTGRIVAKSGDVISKEEGKLLIDGHLEDRVVYSDTIFPGNVAINYPYTVASEQYFILGDNRGEYEDSRSFGAINQSDISSKVIGIFRTHDI